MIGLTRRHRWTIALATVVTAAVIGTAYAAPKRTKQQADSASTQAATSQEAALSRAVAFETALTGVAESVSPSVVSIQIEATRPQQSAFPLPFFGAPDRGGIVRYVATVDEDVAPADVAAEAVAIVDRAALMVDRVMGRKARRFAR